MYRTTDYENEQLSFINFNTTCGMQLDHANEWLRTAARLPWRAWEALYAVMFPAKIGNVAKPCRMVLGSLLLPVIFEYHFVVYPVADPEALFFGPEELHSRLFKYSPRSGIFRSAPGGHAGDAFVFREIFEHLF